MLLRVAAALTCAVSWGLHTRCTGVAQHAVPLTEGQTNVFDLGFIALCINYIWYDVYSLMLAEFMIR